ncbi:MAG: LamG domain-containing protein, partial [Elusimicrobiota bacterium]
MQKIKAFKGLIMEQSNIYNKMKKKRKIFLIFLISSLLFLAVAFYYFKNNQQTETIKQKIIEGFSDYSKIPTTTTELRVVGIEKTAIEKYLFTDVNVYINSTHAFGNAPVNSTVYNFLKDAYNNPTLEKCETVKDYLRDDYSNIDDVSCSTIKDKIENYAKSKIKVIKNGVEQDYVNIEDKTIYFQIPINKSKQIIKLGENSVTITIEEVDTSDAILDNIQAENNFTHISIHPDVIADTFSYWAFDSNVSSTTTYDYTPEGEYTGNDGTLHNVEYVDNCKIGGCYEFDGGDENSIDYISLETNVPMGSLDWSISLWAYREDDSEYNNFFGGGTNTRCFMYPDDPDKITLYAGETDTWDGTGFSTGNWHHVVIASDSGTATLYIDGVSEGAKDIGSFSLDVIGANQDDSYAWNGKLDEFMFFNKTLSQDDVDRLYNFTYTKFYSQGNQSFVDLNLTDGTKSENAVNVTLDDCQEYNSTSLRGQIGIEDSGSYVYNGSLVDIDENCFAENLTIAGNPENVSLRVIFDSNEFDYYSPIIMNHITLDAWSTIPQPTITIEKTYPVENETNFTQNEFNQIDLNVTCYDVDCDKINITLDPTITKTVNLTNNLADVYWYHGAPDSLQSAVKFDISSIYATEITKATLYLHGDIDGGTPDTDVNVSFINNQTWQETNVPLNYNNRLNETEENIQEDVSGGWDAINITTQFKEAYGQVENMTITFYDPDYGNASDDNVDNGFLYIGNGGNYWQWDSREDTNPPYIEVEYETDYIVDKNIIPVDSGNPFYTNKTSNPYNISLNADESQIVTFWVNATGTENIKYKFFAYANLTSDMSNSDITDDWNVTIIAGEPADDVYPIFSNYEDNNNSLVDTGTGRFNVTLQNTNGTVYLEINNENITASNLTYGKSIYNATYDFTSSGVYSYKWWSWGNGTDENINVSAERDYYVQSEEDTTNPEVSTTTEYPSDPVEYNPNLLINLSATITDETELDDVFLEFDGVNYTATQTGDVFNKTFTGLSAGTYNYQWFVNDTSGNNNYSETGDITINKNSSYVLNLDTTPSTSETYGTETTSTGSGCPTGVVCNLFLNSSSVSNPHIATLGVNYYNYTYNTTGNENYTSSQISDTLTIIQATPIASLNVTNSTYPNPAFLNATGENVLDWKMYVDDAEETTGNLINYSLGLGSGEYEIIYNTTGNVNYTALSLNNVTKIVQNTDNLYILFNETSPINYPEVFKVWGNISGDFYLLRNGTQILNNSEQSLAIGVYNFSLYRNDTINYSNTYIEEEFVVTGDTEDPKFTVIPEDDTIEYKKEWGGVDFDATDDVEFANYSVNNTDFEINTTGYLDVLTNLSVGAYILNISINDTSGNTNQTEYILTINQNTDVFGVFFNETSPITYPELFYSYTNISSDYTFLLNNSPITNASTQKLGAGVYNFSVFRDDTTNYSFTYAEEEFVVNKATPTGSIAGTSPIT